jgi:hypothetical protein
LYVVLIRLDGLIRPKSGAGESGCRTEERTPPENLFHDAVISSSVAHWYGRPAIAQKLP